MHNLDNTWIDIERTDQSTHMFVKMITNIGKWYRGSIKARDDATIITINLKAQRTPYYALSHSYHYDQILWTVYENLKPDVLEIFWILFPLNQQSLIFSSTFFKNPSIFFLQDAPCNCK